MARLASIGDLRAYLDLTSTGNDALLGSLLESAEAMAESYTGRRFAPLSAADPVTTETVSFRRGKTVIRVPDVRELTAVTVDGNALTNLGYTLDGNPATHLYIEERYGTFSGTAFGTRRTNQAQLVLTGRFGYTTAPADVRDAVLVLAARAYRERDANYADTVATADGGAFAYLRSMPPRAKAILDSYRVPRMALV